MAVITPDTFDPLRRYVGVRLQQGVPIVDADENEREDIRRFELRAFLKWFVGDGVPEGNDGFRIEALPSATESATDFMIRAGGPEAPAGTDNLQKGLKYVGRCLVDGYDVIIEEDVRFSEQPLHPSQPGAAALAARYGVPVISPMNAGDKVTPYLDVWHRLVTPTEDPTLVHPGLGTESCSRHRREWVVRVRRGGGAPVPGDSDYLDGHSYHALAYITSKHAGSVIKADSIWDMRERRLLVPPAGIINDAFGTSPLDYRRGIGSPALNLREAINTVLRGELPSGPEFALRGSDTPHASLGKHASVYDGGYVVSVWSPYQGQLYLTRLDLNRPELGPSAALTITAAPRTPSQPHVIKLNNGELLVVYQDSYNAEPQSRIRYKRGTFDTLADAPDQRLNPDSAELEISPQAHLTGNIVTVFFFNNNSGRWRYRRFSASDMAPIDNAPVELSATRLHNQLHVIPNQAGDRLHFANVNWDGDVLVVGEFDPAAGTVSNVANIPPPSLAADPHLVRDPYSGELHLFYSLYSGSHGLQMASFQREINQWRPSEVVPNTKGTEHAPGGERQPYAMSINSDLWLFFGRDIYGMRVNCVRRDARSGNWFGPYSIYFEGGGGFVSALWEPAFGDRFWVIGNLAAKQFFMKI